MKKINAADIRYSLSNGPYTRGKHYFKDNRVSPVSVLRQGQDFLEIGAQVLGSGNASYTTLVSISGDDTHLEIFGDCDCYVGRNCKHVAATCFAYIEQYIEQPTPTESPEAICDQWLDSLIDASIENEPQMPPSNEFIAYVLKPTKNKGILEVELYITRVLKKGGLGKPRRASIHNLSDRYHSARYLTPIDTDIAQFLEMRTGFSHIILLSGESGFLALSKMLTSGRTFWQDLNTLIEPSESRVLNISWQALDNHGAQLIVNIEPSAELLLTDPPLYLDIAQHCIGPIEQQQHSTQQLERLLNAPIIPADLLENVSHKIALSLPPEILPPPRKIESEYIQGQSPTPTLQLSGRMAEDTRFHLLRLRFSYSGHEIHVLPEHPICTLSQSDRLIHIERNLEQEDKAIEQLIDYGFDGMEDQNNSDLIFISFSENSPTEYVPRWHHFISQAMPELKKQGWQIEIDPSFQLTFHDSQHIEINIEEHNNDWFDLHFNIEIDQQPLAALPLITQVLQHYDPSNLPDTLSLDLGDSNYLNIPSEQLRPILDTLYELYDRDTSLHDGALRLSRLDAARLNELEQHPATQWHGGEALRELGHKLQNFEGIADVPAPVGLNANLRHYQQQGLNWLQFLREYKLAGILADDMGLGKTIQTLAHLLVEKEQGRLTKPCLIIAPTSLMSNWRREAEHFTAELKVLTLQGPNRRALFDQIDQHDIILSTYPLLVRDEQVLLSHDYHSLILDEAQVIKNPKAKAAQIARKINCDHRLCLTGTPMENHLGELWALFDFLLPGFLGEAAQFKRLFRNPIEQDNDKARSEQLAKRIAPFMLRRRKQDVVTELPDKTEIICNVSLDKAQAALYESIRIAMEQKVQQAIASKGLARSHITILDALLKLRQVCCDPRLLSLAQARKVKDSAKLELLMQMLPEMVEEGRRILLFSQFTKMLGHIETELKQHGISYTKLTGQTRNRDAAIEAFKNGEADVFLISLKAGGVGLNLTEADTVIHYDPWWNPAAENQATDRAHRIGQKKAVFVYKFVTENSVEEKIIAMQAKKQALAQGVYGKDEQADDLKLTSEDMQALFEPLS